MDFVKGISFQANNSVKGFQKCRATDDWQVGIETTFSAFMVTSQLLSHSSPAYAYYQLDGTSNLNMSNEGRPIIDEDNLYMVGIKDWEALTTS